MGDEDDSGIEFLLAIFDEIQHLFLNSHIEGCCRLVTDE